MNEFRQLKYNDKIYPNILVNELGKTKTVNGDRVKQRIRRQDGEVVFTFKDNGKTKMCYVKQAVAQTFGLPVPNELKDSKRLMLIHKNGDKQDNRLDNLRWQSYRQMLLNNQGFNNYRKANNIPVIMLNDHYKALKRFESVFEAGKYVIEQNWGKANSARQAADNISAALVGRNLHAYGYRWAKDW